MIKSFKLKIESNDHEEALSCIICHRGGDEYIGNRPEWIVYMKSPFMRLWGGLHEECRKRSEYIEEEL